MGNEMLSGMICRLKAEAMSQSLRHRVLAAISVLAVLLTMVSLTGCGNASLQPDVKFDSTPVPDLTEAQEKRIRGSIIDTLDHADKTKNAADLNPRVTGPAYEVRSSELQIAASTGKLDPRTTIPRDLAQTVIPTTSGWPRSVFSITANTSDQQSKRLMVMRQSEARSNYQLWGVVRLFPSVTLPKFAIPSIGSQMGEADDSGLVTTPKQAVQQYADLLTHGSQSKYDKRFADDHFRDDLSKLSQTVQEGMERNNGSQSQVFTPKPGAIYVMRSADGGDLVMAQIDSQWTRQAGEGRESQTASDEEKVLFGGGKATSTMRVTYVNVVALYVPAADSGQKVTAVGAERQPVKVEAL